MSDPRDTQDSFDTTLMGPGFFVFFQRGIIESGGWDSDPYPFIVRPKFKAKGKDKKAKPILEEIAEKILKTPKIETSKEIELILRMRLKVERLRFKNLYLTWLTREVEKEHKKRKKRKKDSEAVLLLLH